MYLRLVCYKKMVVIGVKSQFVSLFITLATAVAELCWTTFVLLFISHREQRKLETGSSLSVRGHQRKIILVLAACVIAFVVIEIVVGAQIEDDLTMDPFIEPCLQTGINTGKEFTSAEQPLKSFTAQTSCSKFKNFRLEIFLSNISLTSPIVSCGEDRVFELHIRDQPMRKLKQAKPYCGEDFWGYQFCSFTRLQNDVFSFTDPLYEDEMSANETKFTDVKLYFQPESQDKISQRLITIISNGETHTDIDAILYRVLLGSRQATCTFFEARRVTRVPGAVVGLLVSIWCCSIILFVGLTCCERKVMFDLNNSCDWSKVLLPPRGISNENIVDATVSVENVNETPVYVLQLRRGTVAEK